MARPTRPKAVAAILVLAVAVAVQARVPLRSLLQAVVPPTYTPKVSLPLQTMVSAPYNTQQPIYGPCAAVSSAVSRSYSSGSFSGAMQCQGFKMVYYVGDEPGTEAESMACYNPGGARCYAGSANCGCVYPPQTDKRWSCYATGNIWWPFDCGWRPQYYSWTGGGPGAGYCLVRRRGGAARGGA